MPGLNTTADSTAVPFDPYELKDVVGGTIRDPYPAMHALRRMSPVHSGPIDLGEGAEIADPTKPAPVTVFGYDEVVQVLRDNETYSSTIYEEVMGMVMGRTILQMDEPEHRSIRTLVASSFRSKMLERWEEDLVARVVNELIDTFIDEGRTDLVRSVTFNFPVQVIARILGLPREDYPKFQRWTLELTSVAANWERGIAASAALRDYFAEVMEERRSAPGRRPHQRAGADRGRRRPPHRRGDLLLPPADPAGRGGDDLPRLGQHAVRACCTTGRSSTRSTTTARCSPRRSRKWCAGSRRCASFCAGPPARRSWPA